MNNYYNLSKSERLEEAESLRLHAQNLRAHISKHNSFEFDMEKIVNEYDERARILEERN